MQKRRRRSGRGAKAGRGSQLVRSLAGPAPPRAGSLIVSVFGDCISQHGNSVWLGSLIRVLEPFGLNARQIRTAVFRLVRDGWLSVAQSGRRSFYSLADAGIRRYEKAARRIYALKRPAWDGVWTLAVPSLVPGPLRAGLRRELLWLGYGQLAPGVLAHPAADRQSLDETLREHRVSERAIIFEARIDGMASPAALRALCGRCWNLADIARRYRKFLKVFSPLKPDRKRFRDDEACFQIRTMLIHEYRRILLHDTDLPDELLPEDWPGRQAVRLTSDLYRLVQAGALRYLAANLESAGGGLPPPARSFYLRFGGLERC